MRRLIIPPVVFAAAMAAMLALHRIAPSPALPPAGWQPVADGFALALVAVGGAIAAAALLAFRRAGTSPRPWAAATALVTTGPYRFSRNPMYLALGLWLLALALALGSLLPVVVLPVFIVAIDRLFIRPEEARLAERFGPVFARWRHQVRRWL
jgi:protein-S-isoprenylcysteine O-methyltransferase Ste14